MKLSFEFIQGLNIYKLSANFNQILWLLKGTILPVIRKDIKFLESNWECTKGIF